MTHWIADAHRRAADACGGEMKPKTHWVAAQMSWGPDDAPELTDEWFKRATYSDPKKFEAEFRHAMAALRHAQQKLTSYQWHI